MKEITVKDWKIEYLFNYAYQLQQQEVRYLNRRETSESQITSKMDYDLSQTYRHILQGVVDAIEIIGLESEYRDFLESKINK